MNLRRWVRYVGGTGAFGALVLWGGWLAFADEPSRWNALLLGVGIALPVQWGSFALLLRFRGKATGFLGAWLGGSALRLAGVAVVVGLVLRLPGVLDPLVALVGVAGLFFVLHLLEPWGLRQGELNRNPDAGANDG
jgi:hypothetical protein